MQAQVLERVNRMQYQINKMDKKYNKRLKLYVIFARMKEKRKGVYTWIG